MSERAFYFRVQFEQFSRLYLIGNKNLLIKITFDKTLLFLNLSSYEGFYRQFSPSNVFNATDY